MLYKILAYSKENEIIRWRKETNENCEHYIQKERLATEETVIENWKTWLLIWNVDRICFV